MSIALKNSDTQKVPRLGSLDAYRGLVMVALAAGGFGLAGTADNLLKENPESVFLKQLAYQFKHVEWVGCAFWDLIQPSFMFMVGVAMPYSYSRRTVQGQSSRMLLLHALFRSLMLILLGVFLSSKAGLQPNFVFFNVLCQIGLGYTFLYLLCNRPAWLQLLVAQGILIAYWAWFALTPLPAEGFDIQAALPENFTGILTGFPAHWQNVLNPAAKFDTWFLNVFPREEAFLINKGGYTTLNFVPALVTMILGLMTGEAIRNAESKTSVFFGLLICAAIGLASGWALNYFGFCPLVKRIWTPGWTLFSTGWCWLILAGFYLVMDVIGFKAWAFPLIVAGRNSILLYLMGEILRGWTAKSLQGVFGEKVFSFYRDDWANYEPLIRNSLVFMCFWLFVYWLYRQKLFVRI